jgi:lincosamide nucleotidyltransferase A/C/D/E
VAGDVVGRVGSVLDGKSRASIGHEFTIADVTEHLDLFDELQISVCIGGGWGVDALLGEQTRPHSDLDIVLGTAESEALEAALRERGFTDSYTADHTAWNFVVEDARGRRIDFHVVEFAEDGRITYGPPERGYEFPPESLSGSGVIGGRTVICHPPDFQVEAHTGYELTPKDLADVQALHERFGIPLPAEYRDTP